MLLLLRTEPSNDLSYLEYFRIVRELSSQNSSGLKREIAQSTHRRRRGQKRPFLWSLGQDVPVRALPAAV